MIKVVSFDIGGVVFTSIEEAFDQVVSKTFHVKDFNKSNQTYYFVHDLFRDLETGSINEKQFWQKIADAMDQPLPKNWKNLFDEVFQHQTIRPKIKQVIEQLKSKGIKVVALSNVSEEKAKDNRKRGYYNMFDDTVLSCEVGYWKPDKEIFTEALNKMQVKPEETLFVDDVIENVAGAKALNIHAIHFLNENNFLQEFEKYHLL